MSHTRPTLSSNCYSKFSRSPRFYVFFLLHPGRESITSGGQRLPSPEHLSVAPNHSLSRRCSQSVIVRRRLLLQDAEARCPSTESERRRRSERQWARQAPK